MNINLFIYVSYYLIYIERYFDAQFLKILIKKNIIKNTFLIIFLKEELSKCSTNVPKNCLELLHLSNN